MWVSLMLKELWFSQLSVDDAIRARICRDPPLVHRCTSGRSRRFGHDLPTPGSLDQLIASWRFASAGDLQCVSGVAAVALTSGNAKSTPMRRACPKFLRQTVSRVCRPIDSLFDVGQPGHNRSMADAKLPIGGHLCALAPR